MRQSDRICAGTRRSLILSMLMVAVAMTGCGRGSVATDESGEGDGKQAIDPRFTQSFADATRKDSLPFWRPPEKTMTDRPIVKLYEEVKGIWSSIQVTDSSGRPLPLVATLDTSAGVIEIELNADAAPNHVRNFLALAKVGYYDGLVFERIRKEGTPGGREPYLEAVEAGCPVGTGDEVSGSLGYWLKPEPSAHASNTVGAVGAVHGLEADTAATRFYILLNDAPFLDGKFTVFGKVGKGLDVVRTIFQKPAREAENSPELTALRPVDPVVIRKVSIETRVPGSR